MALAALTEYGRPVCVIVRDGYRDTVFGGPVAGGDRDAKLGVDKDAAQHDPRGYLTRLRIDPEQRRVFPTQTVGRTCRRPRPTSQLGRLTVEPIGESACTLLDVDASSPNTGRLFGGTLTVIVTAIVPLPPLLSVATTVTLCTAPSVIVTPDFVTIWPPALVDRMSNDAASVPSSV